MIKRESFRIHRHLFGDLLSKGPWTYNNQTYHYYDHVFEIDEGEDHFLIVKRESDDKLFMLKWTYYAQTNKYEFGEFITEVFQTEDSYE